MPAKRRRGRVFKSMRKTGPTSCDECQARIVYVTMTATGKRVPVDPIPDDKGTVCGRLVGNILVGYVVSQSRPHERPYTRYTAHFGTCPDRPRPEPKPQAEPAPTLFECGGADFSLAATSLGQGVIEHADRDGLTGVKRAVFIDRGGHAPGEVCPTAPLTEPVHEYWCQWPDDECVCPPR